jgi:hypothetical protein
MRKLTLALALVLVLGLIMEKKKIGTHRMSIDASSYRKGIINLKIK